MVTLNNPNNSNSGCLPYLIAIGGLIVAGLFLLWLFTSKTPQENPEMQKEEAVEQQSSSEEVVPGKGTPLSVGGPLGEGLVALWHFDGDAQDTSSYKNHGMSHGSPMYVTGVINQAIKLDGIDDYVEVADAPSLNPKDAISIQAWIQPVNFQGVGNNGIIDKGFTSHVAPHYQYHLGITGPQYDKSQFGFWASIIGKSEQTSTESTPKLDYWIPGNWYHLVGTYDGTEVKLYVNGKLIKTNPATGQIDSFGQKLMIGSFTNIPQAVLPATLDELAVWSRALSEKEIQSLYEYGNKP